MELYKFINEHEVKKFNDGFIIHDGMIYTNPTEDILKAAGYKEMTIEPEPTYDIESQYIIPQYTDGDNIVKSWEVNDIERDENNS